MTTEQAKTLSLSDLTHMRLTETVNSLAENNRLRNIAEVVGDTNGLLKIMQQHQSLLEKIDYLKAQLAEQRTAQKD